MDEVNKFLIRLYEASREVELDEFQEHALTLFNGLVPFDLARWGTTALDERGAAYQTPWFYKDPPESLQDYNEFREQDTAAVLVLSNPDRTLNFPLADYYSESCAGLRAYQRRYQHAHALITSHLNRVTGLYDALSTYGAHTNRSFTEAQRQLTELVFPHLREALRINQSLHVERMRPRADGYQWAMAICDAAGRLRFVEPQFTELLLLEWPTGPRQGLPVELTRIASSTPEARFVGNVVVFCIKVIHQSAFIRARRRMPVDSLSRRELDVARQVAAGLTHKEIAKVLRISPATVRHHIQAVHERAGVHNNAELATQLRNCGL
ncbi:helix-turn-helix transcriptional regulator [Paraburkholderia dilworthii]|uniref:Helix-turn-helix transcriptional regulator n=1 Tax=Paraburkholderia dilworthii TaxID=948106 RepID=A0ABW9DJG6_9BURK